MKKNFTSCAIVCALLALVSGPALFAEDILNANDLDPAALTSAVTFEKFTITATADKGASIDAMDTARTASDGEVFNTRIKLGGTGNAGYRSIKFSTAGKAELTVYVCSSSKTDARVVNLVSAADGTVAAELAAPADDGATAGIATFSIPAAGDWYLTSKSGGIYVFQVIVK